MSMIQINFFGDFVAPYNSSISDIQIEASVMNIINTGNINIVNFEAPCPSPNTNKKLFKSGPSLMQPHEAPLWLEQKGFQLASLSNNHIMDYDEKGLNETLNAFPSSVKTFGAGTWEHAYNPQILTINNGCKLAFMGLTHCEFGTLTDKADARQKSGCAWICHPDIEKIITQTKLDVDYLFIFAHAGVENIEYPLPEWRERYRHFIDLGCDGVIASHPHIQQGWEIYNGKPIAYSLGNFFFPKAISKPAFWYKSLCASVNIADDGAIRLNMIPLKFAKNTISLDTTDETKHHLQILNHALANKAEYIQQINKECVQLLPLYYQLFEYGGLFQRIPYKLIVKNILKRCLGRKTYHGIPIHTLNNLQCESHRWCISRALRIKYDIK